jgi:hypothetical protein
MLSVGCELPVYIVFQLLEGWGSYAAKGKYFFLGIDIDFNVIHAGIVRRYIFVPADINIPVVPCPLEIQGFKVVDLIL